MTSSSTPLQPPTVSSLTPTELAKVIGYLDPTTTASDIASILQRLRAADEGDEVLIVIGGHYVSIRVLAKRKHKGVT